MIYKGFFKQVFSNCHYNPLVDHGIDSVGHDHRLINETEQNRKQYIPCGEIRHIGSRRFVTCVYMMGGYESCISYCELWYKKF